MPARTKARSARKAPRRGLGRALAGALAGLLLVLPAGVRAGPPAAGELVQPVLQNNATIDYPPALLELDPRPEGRVVVKFVLGVDGIPRELEVTEGVHPVIDQAALVAVGGLRYQPATFKGEPVELVMSIGIEIEAPPPAPAPDLDPEPEASPGSGGGEDAGDDGKKPKTSGPVRMRGRVLEAGRRTPVSGASVLVVPAPPDLPVGRIKKKIYGEDTDEPEWSFRVFSDDEGRFALPGLPDERVRVVILTQGHARLDYIEQLPDEGVLEVEYYQERLVENPYRTTVTSQRGEPIDVAKRTISVEEINNLPGTQGDALKSITNFPGVARSPFGIGLLVIRGSAPTDSQVYLGYHRIPQLFHFGAIASVFNADMLAQIDFIPGNFDSRFGDAIGGIINVAPRKGRSDGFHGYIDADVFDIGALVEGPIGKGSYALSARRSYIDALLPAVVPEDAGLGLVQAPRYWDYQALFDYPVGGGELSARVFGSDDRVELIIRGVNEDEVDARDQAGTAIMFHRADLVYRKQDGPWEFLVTPSYRFDRATGYALDVFSFALDVHSFSGRAEITRWFSRRYQLRIGTELIAGSYTIDAEAPSFGAGFGLGSTDVRNVGDFGSAFANPSLYATATIGLHDRFVLYPGARFQYYGIILNKAGIDPRLRFAWRVLERTTIKGGVGHFSQAPEITQVAELWGNPELGLERSIHTSLGVAQELPFAMNVELTGFYKYVWDRITPSTALLRDPETTIRVENWANQGQGHIVGAELLFRKGLTDRLFGWVSYTLSRSLEQREPGEPFVPFSFDQTHILTLLAVYKLPRNWQFGARFRLVSGNPRTPLTDGVFNAESGGYLALVPERRTDRLPAFHQLDLRVDKRWIFKRVIVNLYLDILNVYNQQNVEAINYSYNFQTFVPTTGLPIVPSLGLRISW